MKIIKEGTKKVLTNRIIVAGSRTFDDYYALECIMDSTLLNLSMDKDSVEIVSGCARGADLLGERYAKDRGIAIKRFPAKWEMYGKSAGVVRNKEMIDYASESGYNGVLVAFWDGKSRGTGNSIRQGKKAGLRVEVFEYSTSSCDDLVEGVSRTTDGFRFDFTEDRPTDLMYLTQTKIYSSRFSDGIRYYGYKLNSKQGREDKNLFLNYVKSNAGENDENVHLMIDKCVDNLHRSIGDVDFGCMVTLPSTSHLNSLLASKIAQKFSINNTICLSKKPSYEVKIDYDEIRSKYRGEDYESFVKDVESSINLAKNKGEVFNIKRVFNRYRQYVSQIFNMENTSIDLGVTTDILLLDDVKTTGKSLRLAIKLLKDSGYVGNIHIVTLLSY